MFNKIKKLFKEIDTGVVNEPKNKKVSKSSKEKPLTLADFESAWD